MKCQRANMPVCAAEQLLQCCSQILPEKQSSAHQYRGGCSLSLGLSLYGRVPDMHSVNFLAPSNRYVSAAHIPLQKVCAGTLSEIISK